MPISATKPTDIPRWATDAMTRLEPSAGQKDTGWTNGQRPPFNIMNWLQGVIYDWQQYFEDATDQLDATKFELDGSDFFAGDLLPNPSATWDLGSAAKRWDTIHTNNLVVYFTAAVDALEVDGAVTTNLIPNADAQDLGSVTKRWDVFAKSITMYGDIIADANETRNLGADGTRFLNVYANDYIVDNDVLPRTDATSILGSASLTWDNAHLQRATFYESVTKTTSIKDTLTKVNIVKAWGVVDVRPGGGAAVLDDGFNVTSVTRNADAAAGLDVVLAQDSVSADYVVVATPENFTPTLFIKNGSMATTGFTIKGWDANTAAEVDFDVATGRIHFIVMARQ